MMKAKRPTHSAKIITRSITTNADQSWANALVNTSPATPMQSPEAKAPMPTISPEKKN